MEKVGNKLVLGRKNCTNCNHIENNPGKVYGYDVCPDCNGTGRGKRGKVNGCKKCYSGRVINFNKFDTCPRCNGNYEGFDEESRYDSVPDEFFNTLPFKVFRSNREMQWVEQHIGAGLFSCVDYGRHKEMSDDELIEEVRKHRHVQGVKIVNKEMVFCDYIAILTSESGYSVMGIWKSN